MEFRHAEPAPMPEDEFFQNRRVQRYPKELVYTSDQRYPCLASGGCCCRMGRAMGETMLDLVK